MKNFRFPYKDKSLDGVFGYGIRTLKLNIRYEANLSTEYFDGNHPVSKCFDGDPSTFCHTNDSTEWQYLQIRFVDLMFRIDGFTIQNRNAKNWDPLNYVIQGSTNGNNFTNISEFHDNSDEVCIPWHVRSNRIHTNKRYNYFRLQTIGHPCNREGQEVYFNIAEFELFGAFFTREFDTIMKNIYFLSFAEFYIFIVFSI